jgi:hypothetical protein
MTKTQAAEAVAAAATQRSPQHTAGGKLGNLSRHTY